MIVAGYLDGFEPPFRESPLIDGSGMLADPLFWPAFLTTVGGSASAPYAFDVDPADLEEVVDAFLNADEWPVFSLPLAGSSRLHIVMRNFPDDAGVDYLLDPGQGGDTIPLAALDGHFRGPALSWPELLTAAQQTDLDRTPEERLLLLLPACSDGDRPSSAEETVVAALTSVGASAEVQQVSVELLGNPGLWPSDCQWTTSGDALVCLGPYAYRSPGGTNLRLITDAFRLLS